MNPFLIRFQPKPRKVVIFEPQENKELPFGIVVSGAQPLAEGPPRNYDIQLKDQELRSGLLAGFYIVLNETGEPVDLIGPAVFKRDFERVR